MSTEAAIGLMSIAGMLTGGVIEVLLEGAVAVAYGRRDRDVLRASSFISNVFHSRASSNTTPTNSSSNSNIRVSIFIIV
eukprot:3787474-Prorocentrum_lima.AAC.1